MRNDTGSGGPPSRASAKAAPETGGGTVHKYSVRVRYADVDQMGVAYYANYLKWFEVGRSEMFRALGLPYRAVEEQGILMPVSEVFCKFVSSARYDEVLIIETRLDPTVRAGMKFEYRIFAETARQLVAKGYTRHAFVDPNGRVVRPPPFLAEVLRKAAADTEAAS